MKIIPPTPEQVEYATNAIRQIMEGPLAVWDLPAQLASNPNVQGAALTVVVHWVLSKPTPDELLWLRDFAHDVGVDEKTMLRRFGDPRLMTREIFENAKDTLTKLLAQRDFDKTKGKGNGN